MTEMTAKFPLLPIVLSAVIRALAAGCTATARRVRTFVQAFKNRREAHALANLDRRMLADIGITRADLRDAFSEPFWEDPTALLRERALERRLYRKVRTLPVENFK